MLRSMAFVHFQDQVIEYDWASRNIREDYMVAERRYRAIMVKENLYGMLETFSRAVGFLSLSFVGLRHEGQGSVLSWSTRSTVAALMTFLNKSRERIENDSNDFVDNLFETKIPNLTWVKWCGLKFPNSRLWNSEIFSLTVIAIKPHKGDFRVRGPIISIDAQWQKGKTLAIVRKLPRKLSYTIELPSIIGGNVTVPRDESIAARKIVVPDGSGSQTRRNFVVYKVAFQRPLKAQLWHFLIGFSRRGNTSLSPDLETLKIKIFYTHPPEYEDVDSGEWYNFTDPPFKSPRGSLYRAILLPVESPPGVAFIPNKFYVGIIPPKGMPTMRFDTLRTVTVCTVVELKRRVTHDCKHIPASADIRKTICECQNFGVIESKALNVHVSRYAHFNIEITVLAEGRLLPSIFSCTLLFAFACLMFLYGLVMERRRHRNVLRYVDDSNPLDKNLLLVGVHTGMNPLAGTLSKVAIKIFGVESSSMIHILESKPRRSLLPGNDDWFLIPTRNPLGRISSVTIWLNHHLLSDWYCSHIWIQDLNSSKRYLVNVGQWMRISPTTGTSRQYDFAAEGVDNETLDQKHPEDKFSTYYFKELRNRHLPFSPFYLHNRCVKTFTQRAAMYVLRVFSIHTLVWVMLEHINELFLSGSKLDPKALTSVTVHTSLIIFFITATSRLFTLLPEAIYRASTMPRMLQRRMTHQTLFMSEGRTRTSRSESRISTRRSRPLKKSRSRSRGYSIISTNRPRGTNPYERRWNNYTGVRAILSLFFGPEQYRGVNVSQEVLYTRSVKTIRTFWVIASIMIISMYGFTAYIAFSTRYWQIIAESAFLFSLSLLFDALIFEPAIIFIRSFFAFVFFGMSNAEHNWWIDDSKYMKWPKRPTTDLAKYVQRVTKVEYKPPLSTVLENKGKIHFRWDLFKTLAFYSLMVPTLIMASLIPTLTTPPALYDVYRLMRASFQAPNSNFGHPGITIKDVIDRNSAAVYLTETMADADTVWPNEKYVRNISTLGANDTGVIVERSGKGRSMMLLGSTKIIIVFLSYGVEPTIPEEFEQFFKHAYDWLDQSGQRTQPVIFFDEVFHFDDTSGGSFFGASRETYSMEGHVIFIRVDPWLRYYTKLRRMVDFFLFSQGLIPRAGIFTTNYFCPNIPSITTIDFIIEVLPSGVSSARIKIETATVFTPHFWTLRHIWTFLAVVPLVLLITNVYHVCEVGLYPLAIKVRLRLYFLLSCLVYAGFGALARLTKYRLVSEIAQSTDMGSYNDFHGIHNDELLDELICAFVVVIGVLELVTLIRDVFGMERFKLAFFSVGRTTGALVLILMYLCVAYQSNNLKMRFKVPKALFFYLALKEMYPVTPENDFYVFKAFTFLVALILAIGMKCSAGFAICRYLEVKKEKLDIRNAIISEQYVWRIRGMQWMVDLKNSNFQPTRIVVFENRGTKSPGSVRSKSNNSNSA